MYCVDLLACLLSDDDDLRSSIYVPFDGRPSAVGMTKELILAREEKSKVSCLARTALLKWCESVLVVRREGTMQEEGSEFSFACVCVRVDFFEL